ncbi:helix-turn-helix domain-containing protein [Sphingobacterium sp. LRF_L2]|uniref:helix-turn-helix domain-containing protein n=1 Tax=Sphingobacterium sp. LRF_L2 TaxID=3369421 RepID=UPI003F620E8D
METLKFHKTECGVDVLLNVLHFESPKGVYLKSVPFTADFFEVIFMKKARGNVILGDQKIELSDNSVLFISAFQKRQWNFTASDQDFTILLFQEDFLNDFFADKLFAYRLLYFYQLHCPLKIDVTTEALERFCSILEEIKSELVLPKSDSVHIIRSLLYYILQKLNRAYASQNQLKLQQDGEHYAFQFKRLIELHIKEKQRVQDYATMLGISRISLNKAVKEQFSITATQLLKQRLLLEVKNYLLHSQLTISEIAYKLHFSEPNHLMRFFKTQTGITSSEFLSEHSSS